MTANDHPQSCAPGRSSRDRKRHEERHSLETVHAVQQYWQRMARHGDSLAARMNFASTIDMK